MSGLAENAGNVKLAGQRALSEWSLREKIGQMVMCGFDGKVPSEGIKELIRDYKVGGIIYFRRNVGLAAEVAKLSAELRELARQVSDVPLWIAIDQEGGMVARIDTDVALMPGNMAIGATRNVGYAYETARVSGVELRQMGINVNFAPCLDVNNNAANPVIGVRSYGESPQLVSELGAAAIQGFQAAGVSACAKHFPGHGDTAADSHEELPVVPHDRARLDAVELVPFRGASSVGVDAIMTAHVLFPAYEDSGVPSTLSRNIISGLLRKKLGYEGVIFTDCLEMKAISETVGVGKGAVMAVKAGVDVVLVSHRLERQMAALDALYEAVVTGEIAEERIDESVRRILALKARREAAGARANGVDAGVGGEKGESSFYVGDESHVAVARAVSDRSVTLVKNENGALPLRRDAATFVVWPEVRESTQVDEVIAQEITLGKALGTYLGNVKEWVVGTEPSLREINEVLEASEGYSQIVVGTYNASFSQGQKDLVKRLLERGGATVTVAALRNPYDLLAFPEVHGYLACYENRPIMMMSLAKVLSGEIEASGKLPVSLSEEYPYGYGVTGRETN